MPRRTVLDRRSLERRAPKRGVTVRHDDTHPAGVKRVKRAAAQRAVTTPLPVKSDKVVRLEALAARRAHPPERIDNSRLHAGSPMYFYCISCGHEADVLPENYTARPRTLCSACQELKDLGWLE